VSADNGGNKSRLVPGWLLIVCGVLMAASAAGLFMLARHLLRPPYAGFEAAPKQALRRLLEVNEFSDLPEGMDLESDRTACKAEWIPISMAEDCLCFAVRWRGRVARRTGEVWYTFLFDDRGRLLFHGYDFPIWQNYGLADLNRDMVAEKIVDTIYIPERHGPWEEELDRVTEVYRYSEAGFTCVFRLFYHQWLGRGRVLSPMLLSPPGSTYPAIVLEEDDQSSLHDRAMFAWDPAVQAITGPPGGGDDPWTVALSRRWPASVAADEP